MAKKCGKKTTEHLVGEVTKEVLRELNRSYYSPLSDEAKEALASDKIREEVFYRIQEWMEADVKVQLEKLTQNVSDQIDELKTLINSTSKKFSSYQADIKYLKQRVKELEKIVTELEKKEKQDRQIFTRLAAGGGLVDSGASFKEVRKAYKKYASKGSYGIKTCKRYQLEDKNIIEM